MKRIIFLPIAFIGVLVLRIAMLDKSMGPTRREEITGIISEYNAKVKPVRWGVLGKWSLLVAFCLSIPVNMVEVINAYDTYAAWINLISALLGTLAAVVLVDMIQEK